MKIAPCKDCIDRTLGCHSNCTRYREWKADKDRARENERRYSAERAYIAESIQRKKRRR